MLTIETLVFPMLAIGLTTVMFNYHIFWPAFILVGIPALINLNEVLTNLPKLKRDYVFVKSLRVKFRQSGYQFKLKYRHYGQNELAVLSGKQTIRVIGITEDVLNVSTLDELLNFPDARYPHKNIDKPIIAGELREMVLNFNEIKRTSLLKAMRDPTRKWFEKWIAADPAKDSEITRTSQARLRQLYWYLKNV